jgi:cytochrome c biogenesis protein CcmG/thiol:disulfide interchange protein DsbE
MIARAVVFGLIVGLIAVLGVALFGNGDKPVRESPLVGREAPPFELELFGGGKATLSDFRGKTLLINFWASWCGPCVKEAPVLEEAWVRYRGRGVAFIGVNVWDDKASAEKYVKTHGGGFINGMDPKGQIAVSYGIAGVPETYFVDPSGVIVGKYAGPLTSQVIDHFMEKATNSAEEKGEKP